MQQFFLCILKVCVKLSEKKNSWVKITICARLFIAFAKMCILLFLLIFWFLFFGRCSRFCSGVCGFCFFRVKFTSSCFGCILCKTVQNSDIINDCSKNHTTTKLPEHYTFFFFLFRSLQNKKWAEVQQNQPQFAGCA